MASDTIYTWKFNDNRDRGTLWYIVALSIVIWLTIWGFMTKQYWMSFIVLLIAWLIYFVENNSEDEINVSITSLGIKIWNNFHDYSKIDSYSFIYNKENAVFLRLNLNKKWIKNIDLIVNNSTANELKEVLSNFLEEKSKWELTFSEKVIFKLKL
jgi:hypothetical protein